jgi:hypothetical protein
VVDVSLLTRALDVAFYKLNFRGGRSLLTWTLDVKFNSITSVVDVSLLTRARDVAFYRLNYRGGHPFIDSDVGCGF